MVEIDKFKKVTKNLYRGAAPSAKNIKDLYSKYKIRRVISLDQRSSDRIKRVCRLLGIEHLTFHLNETRASLINFLKNDLKKLFLTDIPTFVHCRYGKDRTGFVCALIESLYLGKTPEKALKDAKKMNYGYGCSKKMIDMFNSILLKSDKDINYAIDNNIVDNSREWKSDFKDSPIIQSEPGSFAPMMDPSKKYPFDILYDESKNDNDLEKLNLEEHHNIPLVGATNNNSGISGSGFTQNLNINFI